MQIYRLVPTAPYDDPNWELSAKQGEITVRAKSTGDARQVAVEAEHDFLGSDALPGEGVSTTGASAFRNEKLFTVIVDESGEFPQDGPREVLRGAVYKDVILPDRR
ncbi:hypothetical protein [Rhizobium sp. L1K21]|uniref:hypothetical protein n=1 Tax=Rhizobium sp. L1K21 TaxID=2954933 RepID=UPI00209253CC|nr:hypothetical protein [Rhizobium sp. L1K21]MCO6187826.1 hypothetical protein [Rhizobium sp. L1K21]